MNEWTSYLDDSRAIHAIFGSQIPDLSEVTIEKIFLDRDGPELGLLIKLSSYPSIPPPKWKISGFNRVLLELNFFGLREVEIQGWNPCSSVSISVDGATKEGIVVIIEGDGTVIKLTTRFFCVGRIKGSIG